MQNPQVLKLLRPEGAGEEYFLPSEKLLIGNPRQTLWTQYTNGTKKFFAGVWRSEPGKWKITYTEEEYCYMIEGISMIEGTNRKTITVRAGESFIIPPDFVGTWEVVEKTTKRFVIYEESI